MDVGSEISEKIQLAIKAKLKEINAYVDDELPDYIMIMIANRKPEEQMSEALSLFLGDHAKNFTKWLFELLVGLREKSAAKKEVSAEAEVSKSKKITEHGEITVIVPKDKSSVAKSNDSLKASRWDVKKHTQKKSDNAVVETPSKTISSKEAVIEILPQKNDLFDEELLDDVEDGVDKVLSKRITINTTNVEKSAKPIVKLVPSIGKEKDKSRTQKKVIEQSLDRKDKQTISAHKTNKESTKKVDSLAKRTVSVKSSKDNSRKASTTDKESSLQSTSSKSKKKRLKRSRERDQTSTYKSKVTKTSPKYSREWDKGKDQESLKYNDSHSKSKKLDNSEKKPYSHSKPKVLSQVSSTVVVAKNQLYESEDSDENSVHTAVISKVSVPKRRSRLPPSKQANRSLLLKAVSEAESSIKKHCLVNKITDPISEEVFKTKVEEHKRIALGEVLEKNKRVKASEYSRNTISSRLLRDSNLLKPCPDSGSSKVISKPKRLLIKKRKLSQNDSVKSCDLLKKSSKNIGKCMVEQDCTVQTTTGIKQPTTGIKQQFGDSRRIVSRDKKAPEQQAVRKGESALQNASKKRSDHYDDDNSTENSLLSFGRNEVSPKRFKKNRSPSPCFIVTLDGSSKSDLKVSKSNEQKSLPIADASKKIKTAVVSAPVSSSKSSGADKTDDSALSESELSIMRRKLLAMQEQTKKLKEIQAKQKELLLKRKQSNGQAKPENRTVHLANVHFSATEKQISEHFSICGEVAKVSVLKDPFSGYPKGFGFVEFEEEKSVEMALALDGSSLLGRNITVSNKPTDLTTSLSSPPSKRFHLNKRFAPPRNFKRYNPRSSATSWSKTTLTRNKTWVKPGYIPS